MNLNSGFSPMFSRLKSMLLAASLVCAGGSAAHAVDVFNFNNTFDRNSTLASPLQIPIISGVFVGSNGVLTGISGNLLFPTGPATTIFSTTFLPGTITSYTGSETGIYRLDLSSGNILAFTIEDSNGAFFDFGGTVSDLGDGLYQVDGSLKNLALNRSSLQEYSAIATPEIDGSVLPRALLVIVGCLWLVFRLRDQTIRAT